MNLSDLMPVPLPDSSTLVQRRDVPGLVRMLKSDDIGVQTEAAKALGTLGSEITPRLIPYLSAWNTQVRLGVISALSVIRDPRAVQPLIKSCSDRNSEVRWQSAVALGEIGDPAACDTLAGLLTDPDKYVRYGAASSLAHLGWNPPDENTRAAFCIGLQDWNAVTGIGAPAVPALTSVLRDRDIGIRQNVARTLGKIGDSSAAPALRQALADSDREVRWQAVLASPRCGIPPITIPRWLSRRPQVTKNPLIAGILNFMLPGLGYGYLGKWWGLVLFQVELYVTILIFNPEDPWETYGILFPVYMALALHAIYLATKLPKDPP